MSSGEQSYEEDDLYHRALGTVGFIFKDEEEATETTGIHKPKGTCFFISFQRSNSMFLITNKHVLQPSSKEAYVSRFVVRINDEMRRESLCVPIELNEDGADRNFFPHPRREVDLAAVFIVMPDNAHVRLVLPRSIAGVERHANLHVKAGTDVFTVGYLFGYAGLEKNYPIILSGKLSMVSNENWFLSDRNLWEEQREQAYIAQLPVTAGSSGSPVMLEPSHIHIRPSRLVDDQLLMNVTHEPRNPEIIGIVKAGMDNSKFLNQGLAAIEPASNLIEMIETMLFPYWESLP